MRRAFIALLAFVGLAPLAAAQNAQVPKQYIGDAAAEKLALQVGIATRIDMDGGCLLIHHFENGVPYYYGTDNTEAAGTISTNQCWPGGNLGLELSGFDVTIGIWEAGSGVRLSHQEFTASDIQVDGAAVTTDHATHVAGTLAAQGIDAAARGMSRLARLRCYDANNDFAEMTADASNNNLRLSNHSYSLRYGWTIRSGILPPPNQNTAVWVWNPGPGVNSDRGFGAYDANAQSYDSIMAANPRYLAFVSASNQNIGPPAAGQRYYWFDSTVAGNWNSKLYNAATDPPRNGLYDCIPGCNTAKNAITVGNVNQIAGGYHDAGQVVRSASSGCGPTDDGRIKPDLVAGGVNVYSSLSFAPGTTNVSTTSYGNLTGTSMSTPAVCGSAGLMLQYWRQLYPSRQDPLSSTYRALFIHSADEAGPQEGPDYVFGWGLMNTRTAIRTLKDATFTGYYHVSEETLSAPANSEWTYTVYTDELDDEFKVTIAWVDPAGTPVNPPALNNRTAMLVNDLDLRVTDVETGTVYFPWHLDPNNPGDAPTQDDNTVDNVEQVLVHNNNGHDHQAWQIRVTHKGVLAADQKFSIVFTGAYQSVGQYWSESVDGGGDSGETPATAQNPEGDGHLSGIVGTLTANDADVYAIYICEPDQFSASTANAATQIDTKLFLFDADGHGVAMNDDYLAFQTASKLSNSFVHAPGLYYLAITQNNKDPHDNLDRLIWNDTPINAERAPDGPGAANVLDHWDNNGGTGGPYQIDLSGACYGMPPEPPPPLHCGTADFNCDGDVGTDLDIEAFFACLAGDCPDLPCMNGADFDGDGDTGTDADIEAFFRVLAGGNC